ncbi:MAG: ABC transporter substrate-binding protein [Dehalococcoidia bacterium]|nr:ABC transporter substrate-binding protein [Dehalococcoidia bacterium]
MKANYPGRFVFWFSALVVLAVIAAACTPAAPVPTATPVKTTPPAAATATTAPPQATATSAPPPKPTTVPVTKIKIAQSFFIPLSLAWAVAQKEGYYKEEGLDAEFVRAPGTPGLAALAAGEILFSDAVGSAMNATMEGAPFRSVLTTGSAEQHAWARDPIKKASDLVGKKFGCSSTGDAACLMTQKFMQKQGLDDVTKVTWLSAGGSGERLAALKSGALDGVYLSASEHLQMLPQEGKGFTFLGAVTSGIKVALLGGMATSTVTIRDQKDVLQRAVRATVKGQRFAMDPAKRDKNIAYLMEGANIPKETAAATLELYLSQGALFKDGIMPPDIAKNTIDFNREVLKIKDQFQPNQFFDESFAQAAAKELDAKGWKP